MFRFLRFNKEPFFVARQSRATKNGFSFYGSSLMAIAKKFLAKGVVLTEYQVFAAVSTLLSSKTS